MKKLLAQLLAKYLMAGFYFFAGINHFLQPELYIPLIPDYFPAKEFLNIIVGVAEVFGGMGLLIPQTKKIAAWGIVVLLIALIPSHIYFIQLGSCVEDVLCTPEWLGWLRLLIIHPILIWWAWIYTKPIIK